MIEVFPTPYLDELLYSVLSRYYVMSGYMRYIFAAEDLYTNKTVRPDIEFLNRFTNDAYNNITKNSTMENIIQKFTMFPLYARFLPLKRRKRALQALVNMQTNYRNELAIPKNKNGEAKYLRYCPMCAADDRNKYGETYWHRSHQIQGIQVCPHHGCYLINSDLIISGQSSPSLVTAEEAIPEHNLNYNNYYICENQLELQFAKYINDVFQSDVDMISDVAAGDFLHTRLEGTCYLSMRGEQRNMAMLHNNYNEFYRELPDAHAELWELQKVFTNDRHSTYDICLIAMFLGIEAENLVSMRLPESSISHLSINKLCSNTSRAISQKKLKPGIKPKDWSLLDVKLLLDVKKAIRQLQGDGISRPKKVTFFAVEKIVGLRSKQINNLPLCKAEIVRHSVSQYEYWASEVVWAANTLIREGNVSFNWKSIRALTNMRHIDLYNSIPYLHMYTDDKELIAMISAL